MFKKFYSPWINNDVNLQELQVLCYDRIRCTKLILEDITNHITAALIRRVYRNDLFVINIPREDINIVAEGARYGAGGGAARTVPPCRTDSTEYGHIWESGRYMQERTSGRSSSARYSFKARHSGYDAGSISIAAPFMLPWSFTYNFGCEAFKLPSLVLTTTLACFTPSKVVTIS